MQDGDGFLDHGDIAQMLLSMDIEPLPDIVAAMMSQADTNRDGRISFAEYAAVALLW